MVSGYSDIIVMRHPKAGAAKAASLYSRVPVVNAGDGGHLHPTQTLTDLVTLNEETGRLTDLCICCCGDRKNGRTGPVSYTHLDVYKRQASAPVGRANTSLAA